MKKVLCLLAALTLALTSLSCRKIEARMEIKQANEAYQKEDYATALQHYTRARTIDPSFPELERMIEEKGPNVAPGWTPCGPMACCNRAPTCRRRSRPCTAT